MREGDDMKKPRCSVDPTCTFYLKGQCDRPFKAKDACWNCRYETILELQLKLKECRKVNINTRFRVVLTPYGEEIARGKFAGVFETSDWDVKNHALTMELWGLMFIFGEVLWMGNNRIPFVHNRMERCDE